MSAFDRTLDGVWASQVHGAVHILLDDHPHPLCRPRGLHHRPLGPGLLLYCQRKSSASLHGKYFRFKLWLTHFTNCYKPGYKFSESAASTLNHVTHFSLPLYDEQHCHTDVQVLEVWYTLSRKTLYLMSNRLTLFGLIIISLKMPIDYNRWNYQ